MKTVNDWKSWVKKSAVLLCAACLGRSTTAAAGQADSTGRLYPELYAAMTRLTQGQPTTIVFFGGSITWGATATDPLRTSWRALVEKELRRRQPRTPLTTVDAAIGGQPSKLGAFRMDRDVLPYKPDLCFVEFAVNDWGAPDSQETMEGIIRKLRACRPNMAVVLVLIGSDAAYDRSPSHPLQVKLAEHYGLPIIDIHSAVKARLGDGMTTRDILTDGCHPNDRGYRLYADIVLERLYALAAQAGTPTPTPAAPLTANRYQSARMIELAKLPMLAGWEADVPDVVGTWFDQTPSRWLDSVVRPTRAGAWLETTHDVTGAGLYFELVPDGKPLLLKADDIVHLELDTANKFAFCRLAYAFKFFDAPARRRLILEAPEGGAVVAYLLTTGNGTVTLSHER